MINFAKKESMAAAFDLVTVARMMKRSPKVFVQAWLLLLGLGWLAVLLPCLSVFGVMFLPMVTFIANNIAGIMLARAWRSAESELYTAVV